MQHISSDIFFQVLNELPDDGSASLATTLEAQSSVWQRFYQTCLQYQKSVCSPLGLAQQSSECADAVSLVKKVTSWGCFSSLNFFLWLSWVKGNHSVSLRFSHQYKRLLQINVSKPVSHRIRIYTLIVVYWCHFSYWNIC